jgi:hypothetical protein
VRTDVGQGAHLLGDRKGALEQLVQGGAQGAGQPGLAHRQLDLAQDLRLAEHHRIQPRGDAEGVTRGIAVLGHADVLARSEPVLPSAPPCSANQSNACRTMSRAAGPLPVATYSSVRLQVDSSVTSGAAPYSRSRSERSARGNCSGMNAKRPRRSSGAPWWFKLSVNTLIDAAGGPLEVLVDVKCAWTYPICVNPA